MRAGDTASPEPVRARVPGSVRVYIGLGSNLQDRAGHLQRACDALARLPDVHELICSPLYQTVPMGPADQPDYVNAVCRFETTLAPLPLLDHLQQIEAEQGRVRTGQRWRERTLDLDLLLYGEQIIDHDRLQVPHPGLAQRSFVLQPLLDLDPTLTVPGVGAVVELLKTVDSLGIHPVS